MLLSNLHLLPSRGSPLTFGRQMVQFQVLPIAGQDGTGRFQSLDGKGFRLLLAVKEIHTLKLF
jgi:hypothetical protein